MNYVPATPADRERMLRAIGASSTAELFDDLPASARRTVLDLPPALSEIEVARVLRELSEKNADLAHHPCFLGAGSYLHYIPSVVSHVVGRSEFFTSYTPYQPEVSQGTLQTIYEFQSLVCLLTGMELANASLYDGATAMAEAAIMAANVTGRGTVLVAATVHPEYRRVLRTYVQGLSIRELWEPVLAARAASDGGTGRPSDGGALRGEQVRRYLDDEVACLIVQQPNFFGCLEDLGALAAAVHQAGALLVVVVNPITLGLLAPPGDIGADIVVGEGQPLGISPSFGGPYLGLLATRERFVRQLPGRIVGATTDNRGQRGYVLTFQTREQHIRREKATSNICSNEALCALAATVYLSYLGKTGLRQVAELCLQNAHYLADQICSLDGFHLLFNAPFFNEFAVRCPVPPSVVNARLLDAGIIGGYELGRAYAWDETTSALPSPGLDDGLLLCATEMNRKVDMDRLVSVLRELTSEPRPFGAGERGRTRG